MRSMNADRTAPTGEESLVVEAADGECSMIDRENWRLDEENERLFFITRDSIGSTEGRTNDVTAQWFLKNRPPVRIHLPVETLTAAENKAQKSEQVARVPVDVVRYSLVSNESNLPNKVHDFKPGLVEVWWESEDLPE